MHFSNQALRREHLLPCPSAASLSRASPWRSRARRSTNHQFLFHPACTPGECLVLLTECVFLQAHHRSSPILRSVIRSPPIVLRSCSTSISSSSPSVLVHASLPRKRKFNLPVVAVYIAASQETSQQQREDELVLECRDDGLGYKKANSFQRV
jgi:hypothetical protein